jgi:hypothetical protein
MSTNDWNTQAEAMGTAVPLSKRYAAELAPRQYMLLTMSGFATSLVFEVLADAKKIKHLIHHDVVFECALFKACMTRECRENIKQ